MKPKSEWRRRPDPETVRRLNALGWDDVQIASACRCDKTSVWRVRKTLGISPAKRTEGPRRGALLPGGQPCPYVPEEPPDSGCPVRVGDTYTFRPSAWENWAARWDALTAVVTGTVERVHPVHRWFLVRYQAGRYSLTETFKF